MRRPLVLVVSLLLCSAALRADKTVEVGPNFSNTFDPTPVTVAPGEKVIWHFNGSTHTTTSDATKGAEVWNSGFLSTGSFEHTFNTLGSYPYYCQLHGSPGGIGMSGVVNVVASGTPTPTPTRTPTPTATRTPTITPTPPALVFHTVSPCRIADTRDPLGPLGGPAISAGQDRTFPVGGQCGIPMTAHAVAFNVTVTDPTALGHITLHPAGGAVPSTSTLNYRAGQTRANNAVVQLGAGGAIGAACGQATGTTHLIIDVNGYFE